MEHFLVSPRTVLRKRGQQLIDYPFELYISIGYIVFLPLRDSSDPRIYPAEIKSASRGWATLEWQLSLIDWANGRRVKKPARVFRCTVQECMQAWTSILIDARSLKVSRNGHYNQLNDCEADFDELICALA